MGEINLAVAAIIRPLNKDTNHKEARTLNISRKGVVQMPAALTIKVTRAHEMDTPQVREEALVEIRTNQCINQRVPNQEMNKMAPKDSQDHMVNNTSREVKNKITIKKISRILNMVTEITITSRTTSVNLVALINSRIKEWVGCP